MVRNVTQTLDKIVFGKIWMLSFVVKTKPALLEYRVKKSYYKKHNIRREP